MTGMLASVTSINETRLVLNEGIDIIDLKNPHDGALGALDISIVSEIVALVNGKMLTSATVGDIEPDDAFLYDNIIAMANTGVHFVKVGLFDKYPTKHFIRVINNAAKKDINLIIVLFAENISTLGSLEKLMESNIKGVMLDTKNKSDKNLCSLLDYHVLDKFVKMAKSHGLLTGLAGSIGYEEIKLLLNIDPDYLGFRGALCSGHDRVKSIDPTQIKIIRNAIPKQRIINYDNREYQKEELSNGAMA